MKLSNEVKKDLEKSKISQKQYEFLPHTADIRIKAYGKDLAQAFAHAAYALTDVVTDHTKIKPVIEKKIKVTSENKESLLYDFLEKFVVLVDAKGFLLHEVKEIKIKNNQVTARVVGDTYSNQYETKTHVKAMTYQEMEIKEESDKVTLKFILDI